MSRYIFICASVLFLSACAADVGKDKSGDLQNENTNLKVQLTQLNLDHKSLIDQRDALLKALGRSEVKP